MAYIKLVIMSHEMPLAILAGLDASLRDLCAADTVYSVESA